MIGRYSRTGLALLSAALYGGVLLAGIATHPLRVLPVFAALFLLHVAATRKPDLATGAGWAGLAFMAAVQVVLVALCYGLGLLVARVVGVVALPIWLPLAITGAAAFYGAWAFRDAAEMEVFLDSALKDIAVMGADQPAPEADPWPDPDPKAAAALDRALEALYAVERIDVGLVDPIVQRLEAEVKATAFDPFYDAAGGVGEAGAVIDFALLRYVASPAIQAELITRGEAGLTPTLLLNAPHPSVRFEARARVIDLVDAQAPRDQLPDPVWLDELEATFPGEGYAKLKDLSESVAQDR
ncbi:hypothetical protein [Maritimibacter fusiformis]|uniref:Uncharacterized protein n=1 Tax=Maritimibacter fusiformis TaxID=2603819 RepID=A0A5D0RM41_9RHOB|nr:hypothetical protein [Maritimibacter fusiformis]TYB82179.1 hypothetical protein FVF75_05465 [Maritimibacter fusiformis]